MKNKKTIFAAIFLAIATFLAAAPFTLAQEQYNCPIGGGMMYGLYGGYGTGMMLFSWITSILVIALIIAGIYWLIKSANKKK